MGRRKAKLHVTVHTRSKEEARRTAASLNNVFYNRNLRANATAVSARKLLVHADLSSPTSKPHYSASFPAWDIGYNVFEKNPGAGVDQVVRVLAAHVETLWFEPRPKYSLHNKFAAINVQSGMACPPCTQASVSMPLCEVSCKYAAARNPLCASRVSYLVGLLSHRMRALFSAALGRRDLTSGALTAIPKHASKS